MPARPWCAILLAGLVSACSGARQNHPADLVPPAGEATLILGVTHPDFLSKLMLAPYDPARGDTTAGLFGGYVAFSLALPSDRGFVWKTVRPGTYVLHSLIKQTIWDLCFAHDTQAFTVRPGAVVYLGVFEPGDYTPTLDQAVHQAGEATRNRNSVASYMDIAPPARTQPDDAFPPGAHTLAVSSSITATNVEPAVFTPAAFRAGTDFLGEGGVSHIGGRTCFGANPGIDVSSAR